MPHDVKLNEYDKQEWFDVARVLKPEITEQEYEDMWERFVLFKAQYLENLSLN